MGKRVRQNEKAKRLNPIRSGVRSGNPQLEKHEGGEVRTPKRQRARHASDKKRRPG